MPASRLALGIAASFGDSCLFSFRPGLFFIPWVTSELSLIASWSSLSVMGWLVRAPAHVGFGGLN